MLHLHTRGYWGQHGPKREHTPRGDSGRQPLDMPQTRAVERLCGVKLGEKALVTNPGYPDHPTRVCLGQAGQLMVAPITSMAAPMYLHCAHPSMPITDSLCLLYGQTPTPRGGSSNVNLFWRGN